MAKRKHFSKKRSTNGLIFKNATLRRYGRLGVRLGMVFILVVAGALLSKAYMYGSRPLTPSPAVELTEYTDPAPQDSGFPQEDPIEPASFTEQAAAIQDETEDQQPVEEVNLPEETQSAPQPPAETAAHTPLWIQNALPKPTEAKKPYIVVVIDDVGVNVKRSRDIIELQAPLTLSFLPYAENLPAMTKKSRGFGHELMVHVPMETDAKAYPGPNALNTNLDDAEIQKRLDFALTQFTGFVGINNHMGGKFTGYAHGMDQVMQTLKKRELLFLDSLTTAKSVCMPAAKENGVPFAKRDIFIDHEETDAFVRKQLLNLEKISRERGYSIGIGHPKRITVNHLRAWLPTLKEKGFSLVPLTTVMLDK